MCGIVGMEVRESGPSLDATLQEALVSMERRGPDDVGCEVDVSGTSGIGMARLRVRSLPETSVPFRDSAGRSYAFNGEVYRTHRETGQCRVRGGADEGVAVLDDTSSPDGMWALACLEPDGSISVSRDPWGIKPLWLRTWPEDCPSVEKWMVASSLTSLIDRAPRAQRREDAVAQMLLVGQVVDGGSLWEGVRPVPPGARSIADRQGLPPEGWYTSVARGAREALTSATRQAEVGALIRDAVGSSVEATLDSDRATGLAVSGGLDSTIIAEHARDLGYEDLRTVSIKVEGDEDGLTSLEDLPVEGRVPSGWQHHLRQVGPQDYLDLLRRSVRELGQPTRMTSVPLYLALADAAAEAGVVVLVVGEGADEVWGGYRSYLGIQDSTRPIDFYLSQGHGDLVAQLVGPQAAQRARDEVLRALPEGRGGEVIRRSERTFSLGPLLHRTDALMMARSVEARTPFLHGESWALAAELPWHSLVSADQTKVALRAAYDNLLPHFRHERKAAFRAPWNRWLANDLSAEVTEVVRSASPAMREVGVDPAVALEVVSRGVAGDATAAACSFTLCSLAIWLGEQHD